MESNKLQTIFNSIDLVNKADPTIELDNNNNPIAKELLYSYRMTSMLNEYVPEASNALQIAARAQHISRWEIPRASYPEGKIGYLTWREDLKKFHAKKTAVIMEEAQYSQEDIDRVSFLIQKKKLKKDTESQLLEDVICLVFLSHYFEPFTLKHAEDKVIDIVRKTWRKMSANGQKKALQLSLSKNSLSYIEKALE